MEDLLSHPAIQGGVAPFIVAFIIALIFLKVNLLAGLAIVAGFVTMVMLTTGFSFSPLTSTRKLTLIIVLVPIIAIILQISRQYSENVLKVCYGLAGLAIIWILWPVIMRHPFTEFIFPLISYVIYAAWMMGMFMRMAELPGVTAGSSAFATGIAVGGCALIGASALLGQMGMTLAAVGAGFLLVQLLFRSEEFAGFTFTMSAGIMAALILPAAIVYAKVPWVVLPIIALIPLISIYPFEDEDAVWVNTVSLLAVIAIPVGLAFYLTWKSAGALLL